MLPRLGPYQNGTLYEVWLHKDDGTRLALIDTVGPFNYTRTVNNWGRFSLTLPVGFDKTLLAYDNRVLIWRKPVDGAKYLDYEGLIRYRETRQDREGNIVRIVQGASLEYIAAGRVVAYLAGTAQADQTDQADDMLKVLARQNFGATATDTTRAISATYYSTAADLALGPSLTVGMSYRNVLDVMRDIANAARTAGTEVYFAIVPTSETAFEFRTFTGQPGTDRTSATAGGPIFGPDYGNMEQGKLVEDAFNEVNFAFALGQGQGANRLVQPASDTTRTGRSLFGLREGKTNANLQSTTAGVTAMAQALVVNGRPVQTFSARLINGPGSVYGKDWNFGDRVPISFDGRQFSALVRAVTITIDDAGKETIDPYLEAYL